MQVVFNFIGSLFGYILFGAFYLVNNFGVAIIIFTLIVKLLLLPFSIKQQKSMAANARFQKKQREIMERYANDKVKAQQEVQKAMAKENISATAGCLPMIAPMFVMLGVYYSVINPLTNTLHIAADKVQTALTSLSAIPGMGSSIGGAYGEMYVVKYFGVLQNHLVNTDGKPLFNAYETDTINGFANGFNFLGWDLLSTPNGSSFASLMWLIPVLCFVTSVGSMFIMQKMNGTANVVKSQYLKPYLEFSGSCAGCAETSYARLVTQLFGDHMLISNATGCSSIWGGPAATSPYTVNKEGKGPAWANSLFEDNAEHGLGMHLGQKKIRDDLKAKVEALVAIEWCDKDIKEAAAKWIETYDDGNLNQAPAKALIKALEEGICEGCDCDACKLAREILAQKDFLNKKSVWIFGGDGWAFDIGYGGVDHVLASGEDVNIFVFNTEVYSNTGGQASKASNIGQVAQFAAAGKEIKSKSLAEIAMTYGYVYVAQVAMGANMNQTLKAIKEAEAWHGPSLIIGYSPCEMHSIKGGMANCQTEMKKAVDCGYWNLFRYNPGAEKPFTLDSKDPKEGYQDFLKNEARYARLAASNPERAADLFAKNEKNAMERYEHLKKLKALYE